MNISLATTQKELHAVYCLRYEVYVQEMERPQRYANHENRMIEDPLDSFGHSLVAAHKGQAIGTVRINFLREGDIGEYTDLYKISRFDPSLNETSITTRLMIRPEFRSGTLAVKLCKAIYVFALKNGIEYDFIDCNSPLDQFFSRMGHQRLFETSHLEYGNINVMRMELLNELHLRSIKSPFSRLLKENSIPKGCYS